MKKSWLFLLLLLLLMLLVPLGYRHWVMIGPTLAAPVRVEVHARSVDLNASAPKQRRVGALTYMGGIVLTSESENFGGLSALAWQEGGHILALSDRGDVLRAHVMMAQQKPVGLRDVEIFPLRDAQGRVAPKYERDSEALLLDGQHYFWIATERTNRLYRYSVENPDGPSDVEHHLPETQNWQSNGGPESLARLPDGRLLVISEDPPAGHIDRIGLVLAPNQWDKPAVRFHYLAPEGFSPTDAVVVDDTWMLVLHRHFSLMQGVRAKLGLVRLADIQEGADVRPQIIAELSRPLTVDNMEGLAIERQGGRIYLWLVSDDNFSPLQRTLLLRFLWDGPPAQ